MVDEIRANRSPKPATIYLVDTDDGMLSAFAEALRHELAGSGVSVTTVFPGEIVSSLHDHEKATMPAWYHGDSKAAPAAELAAAVLAGIEADRRRVAYPREVSLLALNAVAPGLVDRLLRRLRGDSAAPRR